MLEELINQGGFVYVNGDLVPYNSLTDAQKKDLAQTEEIKETIRKIVAKNVKSESIVTPAVENPLAELFKNSKVLEMKPIPTPQQKPRVIKK